MRVLMLGWEYPPHVTGGLGAACAGLAHGLAELGVEVTFLAPRLHGDEEGGRVRLLDASALVPTERSVPFAVPSAYSSLPRAGVASPAPGPMRGRYGDGLMGEVARFARAAEDVSRSAPFDVVHGHDWMAYPAAHAAAAARGAGIVLHVHSTEHDRASFSPHPGIVEIEQRGFDVADTIVCVSRYAAGIVSSRYRVDASRMAVVHNAIPAPPAPPVRPRRRRIADPVVLFAGRLTAQKSPIAFLDAARRVLEVEPRARFVVAGTGDLWSAAIEHAAAIGIARHVHFTGFLSADEIERAYGEADVYCMPSASEPFGLGAVEAAARGIPIVLSRKSGALEAIPSVVTADFRDPTDLADKVLACLRRPALRAQSTQGARQEALGLSWGRQAAYLVSIYERVRR